MKKKKIKKLKAHCAKLECINEVNRFLIDGLLGKIENMEQALKKIKSDVQDVKEEKQNADESQQS
jgi:hypothetical protein